VKKNPSHCGRTWPADMVVEARVETAITKHAWNEDCSLLAVVPNNNTVIIFKKPADAAGPWVKMATLKEHDALVTDIAWAPKTNRIVTTSQDRNAYVWNFEGGEWKPMLVILRITAAATSVRWSADEQKFAVGSGAKVVPVCYYEEGNNFWVSKMIKDHTSTITAVAWHPSAPIVATACMDYKCRIVSAFLKNLDGKGCETPFGPAAKFGTVLFEVELLGWVQDVAFSPAGDTVALCTQNSVVGFIDVPAVASGANAVQMVRLSHLPLTQLLFLPDGSLVGAGHCFDPVLFVKGAGGWSEAGKLAPAKGAAKAAEGASATRRMFQAMDATGRSETASAAAALDTVHQFSVCGLRCFGSTIGSTTAEFTSSALDGKIVWWTRDELTSAMQGLRL